MIQKSRIVNPLLERLFDVGPFDSPPKRGGIGCRQNVLRGRGLAIPLHHTSISNQWPFPSAPESARTLPKVLEMQRAKRCPESPSLCWTMMVILVGLAGYGVALFIAKF